MSQKTKQILLIILLFAAAFGIGVVMYFVFFRGLPLPSTPEEEILPGEEVTTVLPEAGEGILPEEIIPEGIEPEGLPTIVDIEEEFPEFITPTAEGVITETTNLSLASVQNPHLNSNGMDISYYDKENGKFYKINNLGQIQELSDKVFHEVENVTWSPDASKTIMEYPDGTKTFYDFSTQTQTTLPSHWEDFSFNSNGSEIVFKELDSNPDFQWVSVASPDGTGKKGIEQMGIFSDKVTVSYSPNNQIIAYSEEAVGDNRTQLYFLGKNGENFKATTVEGYEVESKWTPDGDKLLYSAISDDTDYNPVLWIVDSSPNSIGQNRINLGLNTWPDKCHFTDSETLYCAVPQVLEEGMGLEKSLAQDSADDIYRINLRTGAKTKVGETDINASINSIIVSQDQSTLYFTDNSQNNLHKIRL